jgi:hypothetical protein
MESSELWEGDQITMSVTHQIQIARDNSWVKYEATTKVRPNETAADARTRAIRHVNESVMEAVHATVDSVRNVK